MIRKAVQVNISDYPEALSELLKDTPVYDSSCSQEAQVIFIDKDGGYYVKKAPKETLKGISKNSPSRSTGYGIMEVRGGDRDAAWIIR